MLAQGGSKEEDPKQVFVGGIPKEASEAVIKKYFGNFGAVEYVKVMKDYNGVRHCLFERITRIVGRVKVMRGCNVRSNSLPRASQQASELAAQLLFSLTTSSGQRRSTATVEMYIHP